ncbi:3538_t:CDS:1, partial [Gigaspora rosea]
IFAHIQALQLKLCILLVRPVVKQPDDTNKSSDARPMEYYDFRKPP